MLRLKNPCGKVDAATYKCIDELSEKYGQKDLRATTRQAFQVPPPSRPFQMEGGGRRERGWREEGGGRRTARRCSFVFGAEGARGGEGAVD